MFSNIPLTPTILSVDWDNRKITETDGKTYHILFFYNDELQPAEKLEDTVSITYGDRSYTHSVTTEELQLSILIENHGTAPWGEVYPS